MCITFYYGHKDLEKETYERKMLWIYLYYYLLEPVVNVKVKSGAITFEFGIEMFKFNERSWSSIILVIVHIPMYNI